MFDIKRIVIFGDSLSDIGKMYQRKISSFATINKWGRFSDERNWVDYFWEAVGGTMFDVDDAAGTVTRSKKHFTIENANSNGGSNSMELANYAEGGAIGWNASEGETWGGYFSSSVLATLDGQVAEYVKHRKAGLGGFRVPDRKTMFIIWIGANDVVTVNREAKVMPKVAANVMKHALWLMENVEGSHVVVVGLPDPQYMPRFSPMDDIFKGREAREKSARGRDKISKTAMTFNRALDQLMVDCSDKAFDLFSVGSTLNLFQIGDKLTPKKVAQKGFAPFAQPKGAQKGSMVGNLIEMAPLLQYEDTPLEETFEYGTVSDDLHPTDGVYKMIADIMMEHLTGPGQFTFGT